MTTRRHIMVPRIRLSSPIERYTTTSLILQQGRQAVTRVQEVLAALLPGSYAGSDFKSLGPSYRW